MNEAPFDYITEIEKVLVERGYKRYKKDAKTKQLVQMNVKGDASYCFSSLGHQCFYYKKDDVQFEVGLQERDVPPMLIGCNRLVTFTNCSAVIGHIASSVVHRMLEKVGAKTFVECVEQNDKVDFDIRGAIESYYKEKVKATR